tara:strand:+ start:39 stop:236 length:198 start_codon:yes stop_codon:yes gene_type:complete
LKRIEIIGGIYFTINKEMITSTEIIKIFISILVMPLIIMGLILVLILATQYAVHETLWKDKESKD